MTTTTERAAERFREDTADHIMTVLRDDGLYRHLRFSKPKSSFYWFEIITWPGHLTINGDMGCWTFSRVSDMVEFFRGTYINPGYWAEKVCGRTPTDEYSPAKFDQLVKEYFVESVREGNAPRGLGIEVREQVLEEGGFKETAYEALNSFEFKGWRFVDAWEWSLTDYSIFYLWCCHAIQWGIDQFDRSRAVTPAGSAGAR